MPYQNAYVKKVVDTLHDLQNVIYEISEEAPYDSGDTTKKGPDGRTWTAATLGEDLGRFAFRTFSYTLSPKARGKQTVMARATNKIGQTQTSELIHNPAGYHHNVVHSVTFNVA